MNCIFDSCELINGILLGIISSFLASGLTYLFLKQRQKRLDRIKYSTLVGEYEGYVQEDPTKPVVFTNPKSSATIEYLSDNRLQIKVTGYPDSGHNLWVGEIYMDAEKHGTVYWSYLKHENVLSSFDRHLFGVKRLIYNRIEREDVIYLIDEAFPDSKGSLMKEVLRRKR